MKDRLIYGDFSTIPKMGRKVTKDEFYAIQKKRRAEINFVIKCVNSFNKECALYLEDSFGECNEFNIQFNMYEGRRFIRDIGQSIESITGMDVIDIILDIDLDSHKSCLIFKCMHKDFVYFEGDIRTRTFRKSG